MQKIMDEIPTKYQYIFLYVAKGDTNKNAINFYKKIGFTPFYDYKNVMIYNYIRTGGKRFRIKKFSKKNIKRIKKQTKTKKKYNTFEFP
jgi:ribosomal protein S18 acetylase RimI-like enzyme